MMQRAGNEYLPLMERLQITGTNNDYAEALLEIATELGLPESYLDEIRQAGS